MDAIPETSQQIRDNIQWIQEAKKNCLVVGPQARILYADAQGRIWIAKTFNDAITQGRLGRGNKQWIWHGSW